jgi:hypothetical protein
MGDFIKGNFKLERALGESLAKGRLLGEVSIKELESIFESHGLDPLGDDFFEALIYFGQQGVVVIDEDSPDLLD